MVGLMEDPTQMGGQMPQRGVAVPQPQGPNAINILAMELQRTQARVEQLEQVVGNIVRVLQGPPPQQPPQGGQPQPQPGMPMGGQMPSQGPQPMVRQ